MLKLRILHVFNLELNQKAYLFFIINVNAHSKIIFQYSLTIDNFFLN